jgi:hypothetical protein
MKDYEIFKTSINNMISETKLDIGAIYFVLKSIYFEIEALYYAQINKELIEESSEQGEE